MFKVKLKPPDPYIGKRYLLGYAYEVLVHSIKNKEYILIVYDHETEQLMYDADGTHTLKIEDFHRINSEVSSAWSELYD